MLRSSPRLPVAAALLVVGAAALLPPPLPAVLTVAAGGGRGPAGGEDLAVAAAALAGWLLLAWLALGAVLLVAARLPGWAGRAARTAGRVVLPGAGRRLLVAGLGAAVVGGPALALPGSARGADGPAGGAAATLDLDWPGPAAGGGAGPTATATTTSRSGRPAVTVRPGDTLWDLAAAAMGREPSPAAVAAEWPRWYAANRQQIGPNPDLLLPGQRLLPPADKE